LGGKCDEYVCFVGDRASQVESFCQRIHAGADMCLGDGNVAVGGFSGCFRRKDDCSCGGSSASGIESVC